jgi:hypothetical protein
MHPFARLALVGALAAFASPAAAQFGIVLNSGCPGAAAVRPAGTPRLGQRVSFTWQCAATDTPFLLAGASMPLVALPGFLACPPGPCNLAVQPFLTLGSPPGQSVTLTAVIPNDPNLIGVVAVVQGGCVVPSVPCLSLSLAIAVRVSP